MYNIETLASSSFTYFVISIVATTSRAWFKAFVLSSYWLLVGPKFENLVCSRYAKQIHRVYIFWIRIVFVFLLLCIIAWIL